MNFKFRKKVQVKDIHLEVISKKVVFKVISLDETIKGVSVDREKGKQLGSGTCQHEKYERS